ncbi:MAG TPA: LysE family translocator [Methylomirabilota bacterium]|nr:LysE family translocator [Methylomirabilota bacterium]
MLPDPSHLLLFLGAALVIAVTPGPGIFYVAARTLAAGRAEGWASIFGTAIGGMVHVIAGAAGVSALVMASAEAFTALKIAGAGYLLWLGIQTWRCAKEIEAAPAAHALGARAALRDGIAVEALNPKTAAFFLAFLPQFVDPSAHVAAQFVLLGLTSVALNSFADLVVLYLADRLRAGALARPMLLCRMRQASGAILCALGLSLALAQRAR